ncbi:MAG: endonuclease [Elusimicrobia bacterium]|nr:endonuclease [Elusimicrobiota bacterium]
MTRLLISALAALSFALPLGAQTVRVAPTLQTTYGPGYVPGITGPGAAIVPVPGAIPSLTFSPSLVPSLVLAPPAPAVNPEIGPVELRTVEALIPTVPAAAAPDLPGGNPKRAKTPYAAATPVDGWAKRFNFQPGEQFFDGGRPIKDQTGAMFTAVPKDGGTVRVHIVERAPLAAPKAVPGTEGLTGKALLDALSAISARGHKQHEYKEASQFIFSKADHVVINGVSGVVDAYSGIFVPGNGNSGGDYPEPGDPNGDGFPDKAGMNIEHTWPQSLFGKALPMRSDVHHLMATFMHPNSVRGHLPFGVVTGRPDYENKAGAKRGGGVFEPPDAVKGRVARGLLYYYSHYKDSRVFGRTSVVFWNQQIELLMQWNRQFPPDAFEARRNDMVEQWQGNRNPFIDDYTLADRVGKDAFRYDIAPRGADFRSSGRRSSRR